MHTIQLNLDAHAKSRLLELAAIIIEINELTQFDTTELIVDHMTIAYKPDLNSPIAKWGIDHVGQSSEVQVCGFGWNENAIAFLVKSEDVPSTNPIKHITIAVSESGSPVDSNYINDWTEWEEYDYITVHGKIKIK